MAFTALIFTQITVTLHICVHFFNPISKPGNTVESAGTLLFTTLRHYSKHSDITRRLSLPNFT